MAQPSSSVRIIRKQRAKPSEALTRELLKSLVAAEAAWRTSPATIQARFPTPLFTRASLTHCAPSDFSRGGRQLDGHSARQAARADCAREAAAQRPSFSSKYAAFRSPRPRAAQVLRAASSQPPQRRRSSRPRACPRRCRARRPRGASFRC